MKRGVDRPSCTAEFIHAYESELGRIDPESESFIKWGSGSLYARTLTDIITPISFAKLLHFKAGSETVRKAFELSFSGSTC